MEQTQKSSSNKSISAMRRGIGKRLEAFGITLPNKPNFGIQQSDKGEFTVCTILAKKGSETILGVGVTKRNKKDEFDETVGQQVSFERSIFGSLGVCLKAGVSKSQLKKAKLRNRPSPKVTKIAAKRAQRKAIKVK